MTTQAIPTPLTCINVTKDDHIWKRESPAHPTSASRGLPRLCSPPLKHITLQSTQELLESLDPFDLLDSASERSASSAETIIMMTTEEERKNAQGIRNSLLRYESHKAQTTGFPSPLAPTACVQEDVRRKLSPGKLAKRNNASSYVVVSPQSSPGESEKPLNSTKPSPLDDGYGTDSRSNTSASTSSPLSSSFSSLSTVEGAFNFSHSAGVPVAFPSSGNALPPFSLPGNMTRNVITKGQNGIGRNSAPRPVILAAKKKEVPVEVKEPGPNLEDRLRALTTIEEEELSLANPGSVSHKTHDRRHSPAARSSNSSPRFETSVPGDPGPDPLDNNSFGLDNQGNLSNGLFYAVPVEIMSTHQPLARDACQSHPHRADFTTPVQSFNSTPHSAGFTTPVQSLNSTPHSAGFTTPVQSLNSTPHSAGFTTPVQSLNSTPHRARDGWDDYTRYFEKHTDISPHNIASSGNGKFHTSGGVDSLPDKDINRHIGARSSTSPKQPDRSVHGLTPQQVRSELPGIESSYGPLGPSRPGEPSRQIDYPMTFDRNVDSSHFLMSLPDLRPRHSMVGNDSGPCSLPLSVHHNGRHNMVYDQSDYEPQNHRFSPFPAQQYQQLHHASHDRYPYQHEQPTEPGSVQYNLLPSRTSEDEFISLSRSLSKQYMQQREMLQQQQQQQQQQHLYQLQQQHLHSQQQQPPQHPEPPSNVHQTNNSRAYSPHHPQVLLRNSGLSASTCCLANRQERYSWHQGGSSAHHQLYDHESQNSSSNSRASLDLGTIPQLQRQIRATSEMCLQMSKRHVFASSADIYKLFQGQRKPDRRTSGVGNEVQGRAPFHRHSFHSTPNSQWMGSHPVLSVQKSSDEFCNHRSGKASCRDPNLATGHVGLSNQVPLRVDHSITVPGYECGSVAADLPPDSLQFQRQSSGYSSENELQQIESNARASRRVKVRDQRSASINPEQEFRPVNPSLDRGSSMGADDDGSITEQEPFYVNHRMITNTRTLQNLDKPSSTQSADSDTPSPMAPRHVPIPSNYKTNNSSFLYSSSPALNQQHRSPHQQNSQLWQQHRQQHQHQMSSQLQHQSPRPVTQETQVSQVTQVTVDHRASPVCGHCSGEERITQKQVIHLTTKPVTIKSFVPSHSYSPVNGLDPDRPMALEASSLPKGHLTKPSGPYDPTKPSGPHDPTKPSGPHDPTKPSGPHDPTKPSGPHDPTKPSGPHDPTKPSGPHDPPKPSVPHSYLTPGSNTSKETGNETHDSPCLGQKSSHGQWTGSNSSLQLSPVAIAQMLEVPFATNIISDGKGDRLSTLV